MFHPFIRTQHKLAHSKKVYYISIKYMYIKHIYIYPMHDERSMTRSKKTQLKVSLPPQLGQLIQESNHRRFFVSPLFFKYDGRS